jgi:hypothetical protein
VKPFEKAKIKESEVIKNAATKHLLSMKAGEGHKENMAKVPSESNPGKEKMALSTSGTATKQETRAPKAPEKKTNEMMPAEKSKSAPATKQETRAPKAPEKNPGTATKGVSKDATKNIKGGSTEVGGKESSLPNMGEKKTKEESKSWMETRAGAKGKVFENMEDESWLNETGMEDECWMGEYENDEFNQDLDVPHDPMDDRMAAARMMRQNREDDPSVTDDEHDFYNNPHDHKIGGDMMENEEEEEEESVTEAEEEDESMTEAEEEESKEEEKALNEQLRRMKQILKY